MNTATEAGPDRSSGIERTCRLAEERFRKVEMAELMRHFYTADARYITPEHKVLQGPDEITAYIQTVGDAVQAVGLRLETLVTRPCGPGRAYVIGNGTLVVANGAELGSHYLCIFREEGGEWLCETEMAGMERLDLVPAK
jgi:hypothetical protein